MSTHTVLKHLAPPPPHTLLEWPKCLKFIGRFLGKLRPRNQAKTAKSTSAAGDSTSGITATITNRRYHHLRIVCSRLVRGRSSVDDAFRPASRALGGPPSTRHSPTGSTTTTSMDRFSEDTRVTKGLYVSMKPISLSGESHVRSKRRSRKRPPKDRPPPITLRWNNTS